MADVDWTELNDGLAPSSLLASVTGGLTVPNGGGTFVYGWNSLDVAEGARGRFVNLVNFAPMAKGGRITAAIQRQTSGGPLGYAPMLFMGLQGPSVNDNGYLLALADGDPFHIVLKKGAISGGVEDLAPDAPNNNILMRSTETRSLDEWIHLRFDMVVNANGDVVLKVFENDLSAQPLGVAPAWVSVPGMTQFIDDALQVNSGSAPFTSGRGGFAFHTADVTRRGAVDHLTVERQL